MKKIIDALEKATFLFKDNPSLQKAIIACLSVAEEVPENEELPPEVEEALLILQETFRKQVN